jgi:hypothetical protein
MPTAKTIDLLNELYAIENRSLAAYLADACPWTHPGDEPATQALVHMLADQRQMVGRVGELIEARGGRVDRGSFPIEYTDLNLLSLDFLVLEMIRSQKHDIADIERIVAELGADREARELAEEVLGSERAHLEALEELVNQPT